MEDNNSAQQDSSVSLSNKNSMILNGSTSVCNSPSPKVFVEPCQIEFFYEKFKQSYPMFKNPRGQCLIMNIYQINGMPPRRWSDRDTEALKQLFEQLLFDVKMYTDTTHDLNCQNFKSIIKEFSQLKEHEEAQCCVICLMSHGEEGFLTTKEGDKVLLDEIFTMFNNINCPNLAGKPKLFFIQSCRDDPITGPAEDLGIRLSFNIVNNASEKQKDNKPVTLSLDSEAEFNKNKLPNIILNDCADGSGRDDPAQHQNASFSDNNIMINNSINESEDKINEIYDDLSEANQIFYHIPSFCDVLIGFPTQKGFIAYRKPEIGSWYMNAIVQVFSKHSHDTDLCAMLNMVNSLISNEVTNTGKKQMSEFTSKLTKPYFYFFPGLASDCAEEDNDISYPHKKQRLYDADDDETEAGDKLERQKANVLNSNSIISNALILKSSDQSDSHSCLYNNYKHFSINNDHIEFIADKARAYWKHIAREMDLSESQIVEIDKNANLNNKLKLVFSVWLNNRDKFKCPNENYSDLSSILSVLTACRLNKIRDEFIAKFN